MFGTMVPDSMAKCLSKVFLTPAEQGCWTSLYAAVSDDVTFEHNGVYFVPVGKTGKPSANGVDEALADKLWTWGAEGILSGRYYTCTLQSWLAIILDYDIFDSLRTRFLRLTTH